MESEIKSGGDELLQAIEDQKALLSNLVHAGDANGFLDHIGNIFYSVERMSHKVVQDKPNDLQPIEKMVRLFSHILTHSNALLHKLNDINGCHRFASIAVQTEPTNAMENRSTAVQDIVHYNSPTPRSVTTTEMNNDKHNIYQVVSPTGLTQMSQQTEFSLQGRSSSAAVERELSTAEIEMINKITRIGFSDELAREAVMKHPKSIGDAKSYCMDHPDSEWPTGKAFEAHFAAIYAEIAEVEQRRKREAEQPRAPHVIKFYVALTAPKSDDQDPLTLLMPSQSKICEVKAEIERLAGYRPLTLYSRDGKLLDDATTLENNLISYHHCMHETS